jgi:glutamate/tyrosine decarboxylase-like PLP-dependent enzyme
VDGEVHTQHGPYQAHVQAARATATSATYAADELRTVEGVSLVVEPQLGVVLFRRAGWARAEWTAWARRALELGIAFVAPSTWKDEPVGRLVFLHPRTSTAIVDDLLALLSPGAP